MKWMRFAAAAASTGLALPSSATQVSEAAKAALADGSRPVKVELVDDLAQDLQRRLGSNGPVFAEVSVVRSYRQVGCKRPRVVITAPDTQVTDDNGQRKPFTFTPEQDLCADGDAPSLR